MRNASLSASMVDILIACLSIQCIGRNPVKPSRSDHEAGNLWVIAYSCPIAVRYQPAIPKCAPDDTKQNRAFSRGADLERKE